MSLTTLTLQWSIQIRRSLLLLILILIIRYPLCQVKGDISSSKIQICQYSLDVNSSYANVSTHYYGSQLVVLESMKNGTFFGYVSWNLTWNEGATWQFFNTTYLYLPNRTYSHSNISLFTGWWIAPNVQIGDLIHIDGDPPALNFFPRSAPFRVSELTSLNIGSNHYTCWLLSYETTSGQQERFYYEQWTGVLVNAENIFTIYNASTGEVLYFEFEYSFLTTFTNYKWPIMTTMMPVLSIADPILKFFTTYALFILVILLIVAIAVIWKKSSSYN